MDNEKILEFPPPLDKRWEEINRLLVMELENQGAPVDVSVEVRRWAKEIHEQYLKQLRIPTTFNIPSTTQEFQKTIEESIKESFKLFSKECGKQILSMFAVMIRTKIECEKAKFDLRMNSFMHD